MEKEHARKKAKEIISKMIDAGIDITMRHNSQKKRFEFYSVNDADTLYVADIKRANIDVDQHLQRCCHLFIQYY